METVEFVNNFLYIVKKEAVNRLFLSKFVSQQLNLSAFDCYKMGFGLSLIVIKSLFYVSIFIYEHNVSYFKQFCFHRS